MDLELARYITTHYAHLMSQDERLAYRHLATTYKVTGGRSDAAGQAEIRAAGGVRARWLSDQPHVQELAAGGLDAFLIRAGERILREHADEVVLNRCPKCGAHANSDGQAVPPLWTLLASSSRCLTSA